MGVVIDKLAANSGNFFQRDQDNTYELSGLSKWTVVFMIDFAGWGNALGYIQRYDGSGGGFRLGINAVTAAATLNIWRQRGTPTLWTPFNNTPITVPTGLSVVAIVADFPSVTVRIGSTVLTATDTDATPIAAMQATPGLRILNPSNGAGVVGWVHRFEEPAVFTRALSSAELDMFQLWQSVAPISRQNIFAHVNMHTQVEGTIIPPRGTTGITMAWDELNANEQWETEATLTALTYHHYFGRSMFRRHRA